MSDFDKEAEREKLREKYERDEAEREATQRMSDLLLKGATMTNTHCGTCGDPLFQQDGTTFCPSCHGNPDAVQGTGLEAQPAEEPAPGAGDEPAEPRADAANSEPSADEDDTATAPSTSPERAGRSAAADPASESSEEATSTTSRSSAEHDVRAQSAPTDPSRATERGQAQHDDHHGDPDRVDDPPGARSSASPSGDLENARGSLVAALEKFSQKAAETDDPRHAKACLEAAREASETLDVLR